MNELILFASIGVVCIIIGIFKLIKYNNAKKNYLCVIGTIKDHEIVFTGEDGSQKIPIIHYYIDNKLYTVKGIKGKIGKQVKVYYQKDNPKKAIVDGDSGVGIIVGTIIIALMFILFISYY